MRRALDWLIKQQGKEGCFGQTVGEHMYNHALATQAVAEGCEATGVQADRDAAQRGVDYLETAKNRLDAESKPRKATVKVDADTGPEVWTWTAVAPKGRWRVTKLEK